jgi:hypothetical protein
MLAQLKTVVLVKDAIKRSFFRLVEYLEPSHFGFDYRLRMARNQELSSETRQSILVLRRLFHARNYQETEDLIQRCVLLPSQNRTGSNQNRKRSRKPRFTTEQEDKYIKVSSLRNRRLTSP